MARKVWKVLVGIKDGLVLLFMLIFFGLLFVGLSASPYDDSAFEGALLLDLGGSIVEQPSEQGATDILAGGVLRQHRARDLIHALDEAAASDRIRAVAIDLDLLVGGGQTAIGDVGDAMERVSRAGKRVLTYATAYSDDAYQLAAHADEVWLNPLGGVLVTGRGGSNLYYAGLLDRLGVTANVYRVGSFKSAVEPFTRSDMSPEARENAQALANALWADWLRDVSAARPQAQIAPYATAAVDRIAAANGDMARAAAQARLVDRVGDRTTFGRRLAQIVGTDEEDVPGSFRAVQLDAWLAEHRPPRSGRIGVVTVSGEMQDGEGVGDTAGAETVVAAIENGLRNNDLAALVVRVDSPGGSVIAAERMRRAILAVRERRIPVVISFGNVAASGGYWIATAGDTIFAEPSTITGSIGVFGILPSFEGALEQLGVGADGVRTTPLSGEPDLFRGPSPEVDRLLQMGVETTYRRFLGLVAEARRLPLARVDEIAQGRVWDGGTARQLGLVDRFGSLDDAIAEAARRARISVEDGGVVWLEPEPGFWEELLKGMAGEAAAPRAATDPFARLAGRPDALVARALSDAGALVRGPTLQARCLECGFASPMVVRAPVARESTIERLIALLGM